MWVLLRLLAVGAGFCIRWFRFSKKPNSAGNAHGESYFIDISKHKGRVTNFKVGFALKGPALVEFTKEGWFERNMKRLGLASELEFNDPEFDKQLFVVCDHPFLLKGLLELPSLKKSIQTLFSYGFNRIYLDGQMIWATARAGTTPSPEVLKSLHQLKTELEPLLKRPESQWKDLFFWRALFVESIAWGIGGYGIVAWIGLIFNQNGETLQTAPLVKLGLLYGFIAAVSLIALYFFLLRGSSRIGPILSSGLVTMLLVPPLGVDLVIDLNKTWDVMPTYQAAVMVQGKKTWTTRSSKRSTTHYQLWFDTTKSTHLDYVPNNLKVSAWQYRRAKEGDLYNLEIGVGYFNARYLKKMSPIKRVGMGD